MATKDSDITRRLVTLHEGRQAAQDAEDILTSVRVFKWLGRTVSVEAIYVPKGNHKLMSELGIRGVGQTLDKEAARKLAKIKLDSLRDDASKGSLSEGDRLILGTLGALGTAESRNLFLESTLSVMGGVAIISGAEPDVREMVNFYESTRHEYPDYNDTYDL